MKIPIVFLAIYGLFPSQATSHQIADIQLQTLDAKTTSLAQLKGAKPLYVKFWATWCVSCLQQMPQLKADYENFGEDTQFVLVNIGIDDTPPDIRRVMNRFKLDMPSVIDVSGKLAEALNFVGTPYHVLFDQDWQLIHRGHDTDAELAKALKQLAVRSQKIGVRSNQSLWLDNASEQKNTKSPALPDNALIFYTAVWCDDYMQQAKPKLAEHCAGSQKSLSQLHKDNPSLPIYSWVSPLWTDQAAVESYKAKYKIRYPVAIDSENNVKKYLQINNYGIFMLIKNGKIIQKSRKLADIDIRQLQDD